MPRWDVHFDVRVDTGSGEVQELLAEIHAVASLTADLPLPPSANAELDRLNILRAVRGTTGIEGARLTVDEVQHVLDRPGQHVLGPGREREEREALNAAAVMDYVRQRNDPGLTESLVAAIHELSTEGIDYKDNVPGMYRSHPVQVGDYIPPRTNEEVRRLMSEFVDWINTGEQARWDPIIRAVVSHFYIASIHPFGDGNGRTARGVEAFLLYRSGANVRGFYSLANFYYENRAEYFDLLDHTRFNTQGDLTPFVLFALRGLEAELEWVRGRIVDEMKRIAFRDFARERVFGADGPKTAGVGLRLFLLVLALPHDGIDPVEFMDRAPAISPAYRKLGTRTLYRDLERLEGLGVIARDGDRLAPNVTALDQFTADSSSHPG